MNDFRFSLSDLIIKLCKCAFNEQVLHSSTLLSLIACSFLSLLLETSHLPRFLQSIKLKKIIIAIVSATHTRAHFRLILLFSAATLSSHIRYSQSNLYSSLFRFYFSLSLSISSFISFD